MTQCNLNFICHNLHVTTFANKYIKPIYSCKAGMEISFDEETCAVLSKENYCLLHRRNNG